MLYINRYVVHFCLLLAIFFPPNKESISTSIFFNDSTMLIGILRARLLFLVSIKFLLPNLTLGLGILIRTGGNLTVGTVIGGTVIGGNVICGSVIGGRVGIVIGRVGRVNGRVNGNNRLAPHDLRIYKAYKPLLNIHMQYNNYVVPQ